MDPIRLAFSNRITLDEAAKVAHELNRIWCRMLDDDSQVPWEEAPQWQKDSCMQGIAWRLSMPDAPISQQHDNWSAVKKTEGWTYGERRNEDEKTHPNLVPFGYLPWTQQVKDHLFRGVAEALRPFIKTDVPVNPGPKIDHDNPGYESLWPEIS